MQEKEFHLKPCFNFLACNQSMRCKQIRWIPHWYSLPYKSKLTNMLWLLRFVNVEKNWTFIIEKLWRWSTIAGKSPLTSFQHPAPPPSQHTHRDARAHNWRTVQMCNPVINCLLLFLFRLFTRSTLTHEALQIWPLLVFGSLHSNMHAY